MKFKGTAWMMVAFLILGVYYFFVDLPAEKKKAREKEIAGKVVPFKAESVKEFSLVKKGQTITLQRNNSNAWDLSQPLKAAGDNPAAETFLSEIENLEKSRVVENNARNFEQYGLETPSIKIRLQFKEGGEETLLLGDNSPVGGNIYLKLESSPAVLLAAASKTSFDKSVYEFRDKTIFNFSSASINRIQIKREENPLDLIREKEQWKISGKAKAEKDAVLDFLQAVQFSRIQAFESENPETLADYGLENPAITFILEDENNKSYSIKIGDAKNSSGYYAQKTGAPGVFLVDAKFHDALDKKSADFLNKTLIEFEENDVTGINIKSAEETIQAVRIEKGGWKITNPQETEADMATIRSLLFDLREAKAAEFIKLSMDRADSFGLDKPSRSFSITLANGESIDIHFGNTTVDGKQFFAQRTGDSTVFSVSQETTQKLFRSFHELRNKKLFKFETDDVNKIIIETQKTQFELQKSGSRWNLVKPEKVKTKEIVGNDILWTLQGMEFESVVEAGNAPGSSGLSSPAYKVSLWKSGSEKFAELQVGNSDPKNSQQNFAQIEGQKGYYRIKKKYLDSIPLELDRFKAE